MAAEIPENIGDIFVSRIIEEQAEYLGHPTNGNPISWSTASI